MIDQFIQKIYAFDKDDSHHICTDLIFMTIDSMFHNGEFSEVDRILNEIDVTKLTSFSIHSLNVITFAAKPKLKNREDFFLKSKKQMIKLRGEKIAKQLLVNLQ